MSRQNDMPDFDWRQATAPIRKDVRVSEQGSGRRRFAVIEDPQSGKFFQVGSSERQFLQALQSGQSAGAAWREVANSDRQFDADRAKRMLVWLQRNGLLASSRPATAKPDRIWWSPLFFRIPLGCPDRLAGRLTDLLGWTFSRLALMAWCLLVVSGLVALLTQGSRFVAESRTIAGLDQWWLIPIVWLALKLVHEGGHATACKRDGGEVGVMGIAFIVLAPVFYVDVSSTWRFTSRWRRLRCAAAGMYWELAVAACAAWIWAVLPAHTVASKALAHVVLMASVSTLLFNANPLMRFDGYYILTDLLNAPNLYSHARRTLQAVWMRLVTGIELPVGFERNLPRWLLYGYGVAAAFWRWVAAVAICAAACRLGGRFGFVVAVGSLLMCAVPSWLRGWRILWRGGWGQRPCYGRVVGVATIGLALGLVVAVPPWGRETAPAVVVYSPQSEVRAGAGGFIVEWATKSGQRVATGAKLYQLRNDQLSTKLAILAADIQKLKLDSRRLKHAGELAEHEATAAQLSAARAEWAELESQRMRLTVRAPHDGVFTPQGNDSPLGQFVRDGDLLGHVVADNSIELRVAVRQDQVESFRSKVGSPVLVSSPGWRASSAQLIQLEPRATRSAAADSLGAHVGGPLAVTDKSLTGERVEYAAPHVHATVRWENSAPLLPGLRCRVALPGGRSWASQLAGWVRRAWAQLR